MAIISRFLGGVVASYTGTGANVNLDLGFVPAHAMGIDQSNGTASWWWNAAMSSPSSAGSQAFGQTNAAGTFATIAVGTGGITTLDGSAGNGIGLVIGTNTVINLSAHGYVVTAWEPM